MDTVIERCEDQAVDGELPRLDLGIEAWALAIGLALGGVAMVGSVVCIVWTVVHRKARVVRMSQPEFLIMLCVGTLIMASSVVPLSFQDDGILSLEVLDGACMTTPWLWSIGFVMSFSALFSKNRRIVKMYETTRGFHRAKVSPKKVLLSFAVFLSLDLIILIAWTVTAPLKWLRFETILITPVHSCYIVSFAGCGSKDDGLFQLLDTLLHIVCLVLTLYENYVAKHILIEYNEGHYIMISLACILHVFILGMPLYVIVVYAGTSMDGYYLLQTILVTLAVAGVLLPMFVPKEIARRRDLRELEERRRREQEAENDSKLQRERKVWLELQKEVRPAQDGSSGMEHSNNGETPGAAFYESHIYYDTEVLMGEESGNDSRKSSSDDESSDGSQKMQQGWSPGLNDLCL